MKGELFNKKAAMHVEISGIVQGVGFRRFAQKNALLLNITGWVRNKEDGKVEVYAEGKEEDLKKFLRLLEKGPIMAVVSSVKVSWEKPKGKYSSFKIII